MSEQVFADGIGPIVVVGGTVRLDFVTLVPDEGENSSRPKPLVQHRLFMPTEAFLIAARRFSEAAEAIAKLERDQAAHGGVHPAANAPSPVAPPPLAPVTVPTPEPPSPIVSASEPPPPADRPKPPFP